MKGYMILSKWYDGSVHRTEHLDELPPRAKRFRGAVGTLRREGVEWLQFSRLRITITPKVAFPTFFVRTGLQAVGVYGPDTGVVLETKVGVDKAASGYLVWVGPKKYLYENTLDEVKMVTASQMSSALAILRKKLRAPP